MKTNFKKNSIKQANQLKREGQFDEALVEYNNLVKQNPSFSWGYVGLGEIMLNKGQLDKAIMLFRKSLSINPKLAYSYYKISEALIKKNQFHESIVELCNATQIKYNHLCVQKIFDLIVSDIELKAIRNHNNLCEIARKSLLQKNYSKAFEICADIIASNSGLDNIFQILAEVNKFSFQDERGEAFSKVVPYIRHVLARPIIQTVWGNVVEDIPATLYNSEFTNQNKINKIVLYTCVWKRSELTKIVLSYYATLKTKLSDKIQLYLLAVGSEGEKSRQLCESCGFDYLEYPNEPLSSKWEYGLNHCVNYDPDAVIIVGSDDLVSQNLIEFYDDKLREGLVCMGLKNAYFFNAITQQLFLWKGYDSSDVRRFGETTGLGRCLSRILLDKLNFSVWKDIKINSTLDKVMSQRLLNLGLYPLDYENLILVQVDDKKYIKVGHCSFDLTSINAFSIDIKTEVNITPFITLLKSSQATTLDKESSMEILKKYLPLDTWERILALGQKL